MKELKKYIQGEIEYIKTNERKYERIFEKGLGNSITTQNHIQWVERRLAFEDILKKISELEG